MDYSEMYDRLFGPRKVDSAVQAYRDNQAARERSRVPSQTSRRPGVLVTSLNSEKTVAENRTDNGFVKSGNWYWLEIVRPATPESRSRWGIDGTRDVNGVSRPVSVQKMLVASVERWGGKLQLSCRGIDNFGRREDGVFTFYQSPDSHNERETFILSIRAYD